MQWNNPLRSYCSIYCFRDLSTFCCCFSFLFFFFEECGLLQAFSCQALKGKWKGKAFSVSALYKCILVLLFIKKFLFDSKCVRFDYSLEMCLEFYFTFFPVELPYHTNIYECKKKKLTTFSVSLMNRNTFISKTYFTNYRTE